MSVSQTELDSFHRFATENLGNGGADLTWQELFALWRLEHPTQDERDDIDQTLRQAIDEMHAGLGQPAHEAMEDIRKEFNVLHVRGPGQDLIPPEKIRTPE